MEAELGSPKRRLRTLVSSGLGSLYSIALVGLSAGLEDLVELLGCDFVMEVVVDLQRRSPGTGADALDFFDGDAAVGGDFLVPDAELRAGALPQLSTAVQQAADVGA